MAMIVTRLVLASVASALIFASCGGDGSGGGLFGSSGATGTGPGAGGSETAGMGGSGSTTSNTSGSAGSEGTAGTSSTGGTGGAAGSGTGGAAGSTAAGGGGGSAGATGGQSGASTGGGGNGGARDASADGACISAEGGPCGGFIVNPCRCAAGLVCRPSGNPDVSGVCVKADAGAQDAGLRTCVAVCDRCTRGVCCGAIGCCGPGEWCDESSGFPTCKCGEQLACVLPNTCHPLGPSQPNGCGAICCFNICPQ